MEDKTIAVETNGTAAPVAPVETNEQGAGTVQADDLLAVIADMDAKLAKVESEKENYRKGMLLAKGKPVDDTEDESIEAKVERLVNEKLLNTEAIKIQSEKDSLIKSVLLRNKELELAMKSRSGVSKTGITAGIDTTKPSTAPVFSQDQIDGFKAKGWDDKKIEQLVKNLNRLKGRVI
jgi:hypothetical protein